MKKVCGLFSVRAEYFWIFFHDVTICRFLYNVPKLIVIHFFLFCTRYTVYTWSVAHKIFIAWIIHFYRHGKVVSGLSNVEPAYRYKSFQWSHFRRAPGTWFVVSVDKFVIIYYQTVCSWDKTFELDVWLYTATCRYRFFLHSSQFQFFSPTLVSVCQRLIFVTGPFNHARNLSKHKIIADNPKSVLPSTKYVTQIKVGNKY